MYKFPLPENSSVCGFKALIGDREIRGEIDERDKAFDRYDQALIDGHGAYLLDEERPNIFTLSVGNLNPGAEATIEISYVSLLETHNAEVRFFLPTTISPRYVPENAAGRDGVPQEELIGPLFAPDVPYGLKLMIDVQAADTISALECPSHPVATRFDSGVAHVEFTSGETKMDRDFVLTVTHKREFETSAYACRGGEDTFAQLDLVSRPAVAAGESGSKVSKELIFLLDCSGSMQGSSIEEAKRALEILLKAIEPGTRFNLYRFGSTYDCAFQSGMVYDERSLNAALNYLARIDADLGGTEVLAPLKAICTEPLPAGVSRDVVLITDGEVGNEDDMMALVRSTAAFTRVFTVGIGHGPNEYFIRGLARASGGASELIAPAERIEPKVLRLFKKLIGARIRDLTVSWGSKANQVPSLPVVHQGEVATVMARLAIGTAIPEVLSVSGKVGDSAIVWEVPVTLVDGPDVAIPLLWAREKVRDLEEGASANAGSRQRTGKSRTG